MKLTNLLITVSRDHLLRVPMVECPHLSTTSPLGLPVYEKRRPDSQQSPLCFEAFSRRQQCLCLRRERQSVRECLVSPLVEALPFWQESWYALAANCE